MNNALGRVLLQDYVVLHGVCKEASEAHSLNTVAPAPILRAVAWCISARPWVNTPALLCCPKIAPGLVALSAHFPGWLQDNAAAVS